MRLIKKRILRQQKLFWIAIGAGLATCTFIAFQLFTILGPTKSVLLIGGPKGGAVQNYASASVAECMGKFQMDMGPHNFEIRIPTNKLSNSDYRCIIDRLSSADNLVKLEDVYAPSGFVFERPYLAIEALERNGVRMEATAQMPSGKRER